MKAEEIRQSDTADLRQKEKKLKKELYNLTYQRNLGNVEKPSQFKKIKKNIARILTILRERDLKNE